MKKSFYLIFVVSIFVLFNSSVLAQKSISADQFSKEIAKAIPEGFKLAEKGTDKDNLFAVYKKSPQEVITVNLQKDHKIEFADQETLTVNDHKSIFYYMGFEKNAGLVVYLKGNAGYLVLGYNKPYTGEETVKRDELTNIVKKLDLTWFE